MLVRVVQVDLFHRSCRTRLPFRFGITTMTEAPLLRCRVTIETERGRSAGWAADLLVPRWFRKDGIRTIEDDRAALVRFTREAAAVALAAPHRTVFELWRDVYDARIGELDPDDPGALERGFGVAILERAIMDAACRSASCSFFDAWRRDLFAFRPETIDADVTGWTPDELPTPRASVALRHTIGLVDALLETDIETRVDDGFPESLEADIRRAGLRWFKVKVGGDHDADVKRLVRIAEVLRREAGDDTQCTLDGNEQYVSVTGLASTLDAVSRTPAGAWLTARIAAIEQPLSRAATFDPDRNRGIERLSAYGPVLIDEADRDTGAFPRALALGYRGVSVKNCKGVFRAFLNLARCRRHDAGAFLSAEDLTNLPVVALQQDLATVAALGLGHVERNGHHYFRGLDHLSEQTRADALARHGDLYAADAGTVALAVRDGRISCASLTQPGYGYDLPIDTEGWTPAGEGV